MASDLLPDLSMPLFYFRLVDGHVAANYGAHDLTDNTAAQIAAINLARSVREVHPELLNQGYSIIVSDEYGAEVCAIPLEIP